MVCFNNATSQSTREQTHTMVEKGLIKSIVHLFLNSKSSQVLRNALETLSQILDEGQEMCQAGATPHNIYLIAFENLGGVKAIEGLQQHPDKDVYEMVDELIDTYFVAENQ